MGEIKPDRVVDTSGHCCPVPMVETNRAIKQMRAGEILEVISTDIGSRMDIPAWCARTGHKLLRMDDEDGKRFRYYVRKRD